MQYSTFFRFIPAIGFFFFTLILLTLPGSSFPKAHFFEIVYFDKWVHIGLFGILDALFSYPLLSTQLSNKSKRNWFIAFAICASIYGIIMEFVQKYWVTNRSFETNDMIADAFGSFLAYLLMLQILKRKSKAGV